MQKRPRCPLRIWAPACRIKAASVSRGTLRSDYDMQTPRSKSTVFSASRNNVYVYARCVPSRKTRDCGEPPLGQRKEYANLGSGTTARHQRRFVSGRKSAERAPGRTQTNRPELPATQNTDSRLASGDQSEQPAKNTDSTSCPLYQGIAVFAISRSSVQMYKTKNIHGYAKVR